MARTGQRSPQDARTELTFAELEQQHASLFRLIAELEDAVVSGNPESVIDGFIAKIVEHAIHHFVDEESLMRYHGFPGLATHQLEHQSLSQSLAKFNLSNLAGKPGIPNAFLEFLQTRWRDHILKSDQKYKDFLAASGSL